QAHSLTHSIDGLERRHARCDLEKSLCPDRKSCTRTALLADVSVVLKGDSRGHRCSAQSSVNLTASQISTQVPREIARTHRASREQSLSDCVNHSAVECRNRVGDVTLWPWRGRRGVGRRWGWQGVCTGWGSPTMQGGSHTY